MKKNRCCDRRMCRLSRPEPVTERHVQAIWFDRELRPEGLFTADGEMLTVIHPGDWNLEAGPDFKNAVLEVGRDHRRLAGDVEIHLSPSGWEAHGHGRDGAYSNVVAHVTWTGGPEPASLPKGAVSVCLGRHVMENASFSPECIDVGAYPFARLPAEERPCFKIVGSNPRIASAVLAAAGETRILAKAKRLDLLLKVRRGERMQIFYEEFMAALGYKNNSNGFRRVAGQVSFAQLAAEPDNARSAILSAAGFVDWNRASTRPANAPEARLAAAAAAFADSSFAFLADVASFAPSAIRSMMKLLSKPGLMGRGRAAAVLANVVLPFAIAENRVDSVPQWLPPEDVSSTVRIMASRMFGRDHYPPAHYSTNGLLMQGLVQIHRDFCLRIHPECAKCTLSDDYAAASAAGASEPGC